MSGLNNKEEIDYPDYKLFFDSAPVGMYFFDTNGIIKNCNSKFCEIIGVSREVLIGFNMITSLADDEVIAEIKKSLVIGHGFVEKIYNSVNSNKKTPVIIELKGIRDSKGVITGGLGIVQDISPRTYFRNQLERAEKTFREFINAVPLVGVILSNTGDILFCNKFFSEITELENEEIIGGNFFENFCIPEEIEQIEGFFFPDKKKSKKYENIFTLNLKNSRKKISWTILPVTGEENELLSLNCIGEDITKRAQAISDRRVNELKFKHALMGSGQGMWEVDLRKNTIYFDDVFAELLQIENSKEKITLKSISNYFHKDDIPKIIALLKDFRAGKREIFTAELRVFRKIDKYYTWSLFKGSIVEYERSGAPLRAIGTQVNIDIQKTEEKYLEIERDFALAVFEKAGLRKAVELSLTSILELSGADGGALYLFNDEGGLELSLSRGYDESFIKEISYYTASSKQVELIKTGEPVFNEYKSFSFAEKNKAKLGDLYALAVLPLVKEHESFGCINLGFSNAKTYEVLHKQRLINFSMIIGSSISRVKLEERLIASEEKYKKYIDNSPLGIFVVDSRGNYLEVNRKACEMSGYTAAEMFKMNVAKLVHEDSLESAMAGFRELLDKGDTQNEFLLKRKNGEVLNVKLYAVRLDNNRYIGFKTDITSFKSMESSLKMSEARYRNFIDRTTDGVVCIEFYPEIDLMLPPEQQIEDINFGFIVEANRAFAIFAGIENETMLLGKRLADVNAPGSIIPSNLIEKFITNNYALYDYESEIVFRNRRNTGYALFNFNTSIENNNLSQLWITIKDISSTKDAELALIESEAKYSTVVENANEIILVHVEGKIQFVNSSALKSTGYTYEEIIGKNILDFVHPDDVQTVVSNLGKRKDNELVVASYHVRLKRRNGEYFIGEISGSIINFDDNFAYLIFIQDVTERIEKEAALKESERQYRLLTETSNDGIAKLNSQFIFTFANRAHEVITGYSSEELIGQHISLLVRPQDSFYNRDIFSRVFEGETIEEETIVLSKSGKEVPVYFSAVPVFHDGVVTECIGFLRDISVQKANERELKAKEARLRTLINQIPAIIWSTDNGAVITSISGSGIKNINLEIDTLTGEPVSNLTRANLEFGQLTSKTEQVLKGESVSYLLELRSRMFDVLIEPLKDLNNNIIGTVGVALDITERISAQEKIRQLSSAVEQSAASIVITDLNGKIEYVNKKFEEITGYTKEEALDQNPRILKSGDFKQETYKSMWDIIIAGGEWKGEFHNKKKNGELFWERAVISPIKNDDGAITHFLAVKEDITEFKRVQEELENYRNRLEDIVEERTLQLNVSEERFRTISEHSNDLIIRFSDDIIMYGNPAFVNLIPDAGELAGKSLLELFPKNNEAENFKKMVLKVHEDKKQCRFEVNFPGHHWYDWVLIPEFDQTGRVENIVGFARDVTERKKLELKMKESLDKERELNKLKSSFISMASHEFRTPLTAILASADLLEMFGRKWNEQKYYEHTGKIQRSVDEMIVLLDEVLTLSRYEGGKKNFFPERTNIKKIIHEIFNTVSKFIFYKHTLTLDFQLSNNEINIDIKLFNQILNNLLSNAVKYSPAGSEVILIVKENSSHNIFIVKDAGRGISEEEQKHVFEAFYRSADVQNITGTGLGLNIVSESVTLHRGSLTMKSEFGKGSEFTVYLPKAYE